MEDAWPAPPGWMEERDWVHWRMCWVVSLLLLAEGELHIETSIRTIIDALPLL